MTNVPSNQGNPAKPGEIPNMAPNPNPAPGPSVPPPGGNPSDPTQKPVPR